MKITHPSGQAYDLPPGFTLELNRTNPFFHETGEQSMPCSLPASARNVDLLGHPSNIANSKKVNTRLDVTIEAGPFFINARQAILSARRNQPIETSFYLNEGAFYEKVENLTLHDVFREKSVDFGNVTAAINFMQQLLTQHDERFTCFSVITTERELNALLYGDSPAFRNATDRTEEIDGKSIFVPKGMFITPFVKVRHVLNEVVTYLGYTLGESFLDDEPFRDMVFLNNNADTIMNGRIDYVDVVPGLTVSDFFNVIRKFNCEIIPDELNKVLKVVSFNDVLDSTPKSDLSRKLAGDLLVSYPESFKQLKLTSNTLNIPEGAKTFGDYQLAVNAKMGVNDLNDLLVRFPTAQLSSKHGYIYRMGYRGEFGFYEKLGSLHCNYRSMDPLPEEEKSFPDHLVEVWVGTGQYSNFPYPYVGNTRYLRTALMIDGSEEAKTAEASGNESLPAMLCFYFHDVQRKYNVGTIHNKNLSGTKLWDFTLAYNGEDGIYEKFWRQYDDLLRNALLEIRGEVILDETDKMTMSSYQPITIDAQKLLPSELKYVPGEKMPMECAFLTTKLQSPISSAENQHNMIAHPFKWERKSQRNFTITNPAPGARYPYVKYKTAPETCYPPVPTQAQYDAGGRYNETQYEVEYGTIAHPDSENVEETFEKQGDGVITAWLEVVLA